MIYMNAQDRQEAPAMTVADIPALAAEVARMAKLAAKDSTLAGPAAAAFDNLAIACWAKRKFNTGSQG